MWKDLNREKLREIVSELCGKQGKLHRLRLFTDSMEDWRGSINLEILEESDNLPEVSEGMAFSGTEESCVDFLTEAVGPDYSEGVFVQSVTLSLFSSGDRRYIKIEERETRDIGSEVISTI